MNRSSATAQPRYRGDIQGLRALAVGLVIIEHAHFGLRGGFIGVDVFFVISGFVITAMLLREVQSQGRIRLGRFFIRRGYRLIPAAAVVITVTALVGAVILSPLGTQQQAAVTGGAAAVGISNIALYTISSDYFSEHVQTNPFLHTWSLGVEEQFYLFFPLVLLLVWKMTKNHAKAAAAVLVVVAAVSFALSAVTSFSAVLPAVRNPPIFAFYMMPTRAWEFAVGALIACGAVWLARRRLHAAATWIGLALILAGAVFIDSGMAFPGVAALVPVAGAALVIYGGLKKNGGSRLLSTRPLVHLGDLSYSLYLWHWPLFVFARRLWPESMIAIVGALVLTYVLSYLTFRYIETPFRGRADAWNWRSLRLPAAAIAVALVAAGGLGGGAVVNWGNKNVADASAQLLERPIGYNECLSTTPVSERDLAPCTWDGAGKPIYLVGDSNAQQFTEALISAADELDRPLTVATWGGCPFFDVGRVDLDDPAKGAECSVYADDGEKWIEAQPAGTVVIASSSEMVTDDRIEFRAGGEVATTEVDKAVVWAEALAARIESLEAAGHDVRLVRTMPHFPGVSREWWHPVECQNADLFTDPSGCSMTISAEQVQTRMKYITAAETQAIEATGVGAVDLSSEVCRNGMCETYRNGMWLYRDGLHISPQYSSAIAARFTSSLVR
ncbi:acyltransferase family protein [Microbacterium sp. W4I20]|uniref:acyltransferase family protein n=1 Tax=Microbacterium sp. W4I20 TaxID=3042262 RepID=UPI0027877FC6|nr:acyltransferase family protein [Microbacterium sp. W4I20]MDQ0726306.1 peptidoglycan/LPS O-acetylase OafA/YrhL [Microbacterium sp. W4I20]